MSVQLFSPSFLVSFGAPCCFLLHIHLIHSQPRSPLTHASLPSSTTNTQYTTNTSPTVYPGICLHQMNGINMTSSYRSVTCLRGNRTPGSCIATGCNLLVVHARHCSSFQLTHMSHETMLGRSSQQWRPKGRQEHTTVLTTSQARWISACECQWTTVISAVWSESLWGLNKSCTGNEFPRERSNNGGRQYYKSAAPKLYGEDSAWQLAITTV